MTSIDPKNNLSINSFVPTKPSDGLIHDMAKRGLIKTLSSSTKAGTDTTDTVKLSPNAKLEKLVKEKFNGMTLEELRDAYKASPSADLCKISPLLDEFLNEDTSEARKSELLGQIEERLSGSDQISTMPGIANPPPFMMSGMPTIPSFPTGGLGGISNFPQIPQSSYAPPETKNDSNVKLDGTNEQRAKTAEKTAEEVKKEKSDRQTEVGKQLEENEAKILDTRKKGRIALIETEYGKVGDKEGKIPAEQAKQYKKVIAEYGEKKDDDSQKPNSSAKIGKVQTDMLAVNKDVEALKADQSKAASSGTAEGYDKAVEIGNKINEKLEQLKKLAEEKKKLVTERDKKIEDIKTAKGETDEGKAVKAVIDEKEKLLAKAENEDAAADKEKLAALTEGKDSYEGLDKLSYNGEEKDFAEIKPLIDDYKKLAVEKKTLESGNSVHDSDIKTAQTTAEVKKQSDPKATPKETENLKLKSRKQAASSGGQGSNNPLGGLGNLIQSVTGIATAYASIKAATGGRAFGLPGMPMMSLPAMTPMNIPQNTINPGLAPMMAQLSNSASHQLDGLFAQQQGAGTNLELGRKGFFGKLK